MTKEVGAAAQAPSFDYELYEGDPDHLRTVVATPTQTGSWIDPASLKLKHRIGRGPFGDVWLATHHQSGDDYDRYHEVAVKMLHPLKEDHMQKFFDKFEELFMKLRQLQGVCWLHGASIISGKVLVYLNSVCYLCIMVLSCCGASCFLQIHSLVFWQICMAMKFYEGSLGDQMARLKGGKLPLPDVMR